jgi:hypothetical protein
LSLLERIESRQFPLKALNRRRVTLEERVEAVVLRAMTQAGLARNSKPTASCVMRGERVRLLITLEEGGVNPMVRASPLGWFCVASTSSDVLSWCLNPGD